MVKKDLEKQTMLYNLGPKKVQCRGRYFVADSADVIGSVVLEDNVSIWFNAVIRGDNDVIAVGENSNIQDASVLHTDAGIEMKVGANVTVGHRAILHGCRIGDKSMIGMGAVILNETVIGNNCLIAAQTLIPEGKSIPDNSVVMGSPGRIVREITEQEKEMIQQSVSTYLDKADKYRRFLHILSP